MRTARAAARPLIVGLAPKGSFDSLRLLGMTTEAVGAGAASGLAAQEAKACLLGVWQYVHTVFSSTRTASSSVRVSAASSSSSFAATSL